MFTISSDNINKQLNTQLYNTVVSNSAQISTSLEIMCVAVERWLVLSQRTALTEFGGVAC